jgi:hypothetical protein
MEDLGLMATARRKRASARSGWSFWLQDSARGKKAPNSAGDRHAAGTHTRTSTAPCDPTRTQPSSWLSLRDRDWMKRNLKPAACSQPVED